MKKFFSVKTKLAFWGIFSIFIGISLASSLLFFFEKIQLPQYKNNEAAIIKLVIPEVAKSQYFYTNKDTNGQPKVSAKAFLVGDLNTGEVIISKNQNEKMPIASVSKLMTALVAKEISKEEDTAQVSKGALATYGKNGNLRLGEKIKTTDLLYPLLLESSNDAAEVLAEQFGREDFISKMNQVAEKLKMSKTSYEDPSGLSENNKSTVSDIFKLTGYLMREQPELLKITGTRSYSNAKHNWSNISQFLGKEGYFGGKSGYTDEARQTVVSLFNLPLGESGVRPIAIVLLASPDRKKDVENILNYLKKNIYYGGVADANTNWVEEKVGMPDIKDPSFVTLSFVGDIMMARGVRNSVVKNFNNDYSALFEKAGVLKKSDIVFGNLEGTASDQGVDQKNLYSFRMDPGVITALRGAGMSVLSVANNHVADWGREAFIDTLSRLKENELSYVGGGYNKEEAKTPVIIEKYGMKIGFLGFSDKGPNYMTATEEKAGVLLASDPNFNEIIKNAASQVDYLIVSFHFGEEYQNTHDLKQENLAHRAIDNGAKIVIGHHPHVVQDTEVYKDGFIAYSLGNFIFDQSWSKETMRGMILEIKLNRNGSMIVRKDATEQNSVFQIGKITTGKEEKFEF